MKKTASAAAFVLTLGLCGSGCVDNESTLFIEGVLAIEATDCVARPEPDAVFRRLGTLDLEFGGGYVAALQVGSQITQQGNREKIRTETSRMHIEGARVTVFPSEGASFSFETAATSFVHPAAGTDPGLGAVFVQLVPPSDTARLLPDAVPSGQMIARVQVYGTTLGGQEIESGEYDFPIQLCRRCLVDYSPALATGACIGPAATDDQAVVCSLGQDVPVPCTECLAYDFCRAIP